MTVLKPITERPETLSDLVYSSLRDAIVARSLGPGERITEARLAAQLSVSKTPVREALIRLEYVGLIESEDGRTSVVVPSAHAIREAYELRTALELEAVRLATLRADLSALQLISRLAQESFSVASNGDRATFKRVDRQFHLGIAAASGNQRLQLAIRDVLDLASALRNRDVPSADASPHCAEQHVGIAAAMLDGDLRAADERLRSHLDRVRDLLVETFAHS